MVLQKADVFSETRNEKNEACAKFSCQLESRFPKKKLKENYPEVTLASMGFPAILQSNDEEQEVIQKMKKETVLMGPIIRTRTLHHLRAGS